MITGCYGCGSGAVEPLAAQRTAMHRTTIDEIARNGRSSLVSIGQVPELDGEEGRRLRASINTKADLVVTTQEGDRVTISLEAASQIAKGDYREIGAGYRARAFQRESAQSVLAAVSVAGDLSVEEMHDIQRLVAGLSKLVHQTDKGDASGAAKTLSKLASLDSIAQAAFQLERRESFGYELARVG